MANHGKTLTLDFHGRIIEHLGIQMYQSPVAALAEIVANAWDADADEVHIRETEVDGETGAKEIIVQDNGHGMTFDECQSRYLNVGYSRRRLDGGKTKSGRNPLGRKGIGKFAGFGIAAVMRVSTVSGETGERTEFELDLRELSQETDGHAPQKINLLASDSPNDSNRRHHGTTITLRNFKNPNLKLRADFPKSMARRFLGHLDAFGFKIRFNDADLPEDVENTDIEYDFPKDYTQKEKLDRSGLECQSIRGRTWGKEKISDDGPEIFWRIAFYREPLRDEDMRGVSVFAGIKIAQLPFFFDLSGSISAGHALQYISGQIQADFIDAMVQDVIATERQRINWDLAETSPLKNWGAQKIKELTRLWKERRAQRKADWINDRTKYFAQRLDKLPRHEQATIKRAIEKVAAIEALTDAMLEEVANAMLLAWESGRLKELIAKISGTESLSSDEFLKLLQEASVLSALNIAEAVRTKIEIIKNLETMIHKKNYENAIRDYIAENPWLISQKWETFKKETSLNHIFEAAAKESKIDREKDWDRRIDLVLKSGRQLLVMEFMRPGLTIDSDHLDRIESYMEVVRERLKLETALGINDVTGYMVADKLAETTIARSKIKNRLEQNIFTLTWDTLLNEAKRDYVDYMEILKNRAPDDPRISAITPSDTD